MIKKKNIVINHLKEISGSESFIFSSVRHNAAQTFSINFYKPISKFKIKTQK